MVVNEEDVINIMGGMEHAGGIRLNDHKRKLKNRFEIRRKLGQGTYGKVLLGINKETGQEVAIKTIKKSKIETEADLIRIRREIQIMSSVQHPNIIHIYEVFENKEKMVLVMEIAAGGELYDFLSERKCLEENEARRIFRQIATAVYYCHKHNICHRDLKLENILLDENGCAKIADFGLSNVYDGKNLLNTFCGSPLYASPEIVRGNPYAGPEVDCWSLGVLLYTLVYGAMPFDGSNFKRLVKQITTGDYYEPKQPSSASNLIRTMLTVGSDKRSNIADICSHWWVNDGYGDRSCLEEAEYLAGLTPVRLDLLLSLAPPGSAMEGAMKEAVLVEPNEDEQQAMASTMQPHENESSMSIVELPPGTLVPDAAEDEASEVSVSEPPDEKSPSTHKRKAKEQKAKRKMTETPTLLDPDLTHKKRSDAATTHETGREHSKNRNSKGRSSPRTPSMSSPIAIEGNSINFTTGIEAYRTEDESSNSRRKLRTNDAVVQGDKKPTPLKSPTPSRAAKEGRKTPVKRKKEVADMDATDKQLHLPVDQYPQISPDLQRKPPPKPKSKKSDEIGDEVEVVLRPGSSSNRRRPPKKEREQRERNVRTPDPEREPRERNARTPDPVSRVDSGFEDNDSSIPFERPCPVLERPPTPRQARAPSPEDRPLVVPLPPPRLPDIISPSQNQQLNSNIYENKPDQTFSCAELTPPPIPERPSSMQIDTLNMSSMLSTPHAKLFLKLWSHLQFRNDHM